MEFNQKLQELRKQKGLTQEELAEALFVSRTAISKWESGRGYPSIDSLKAIANFFGVTVDTLLSGSELLTAAEEDQKQLKTHLRDLVFGLLDCTTLLFLFLPLFRQKTQTGVQAVSPLSLTEIAVYLRFVYVAAVVAIGVMGILTLALQNCRRASWVRCKGLLSQLLTAAGVLLFIVSTQPYAAALLFVFLAIKVFLGSQKP